MLCLHFSCIPSPCTVHYYSSNLATCAPSPTTPPGRSPPLLRKTGLDPTPAWTVFAAFFAIPPSPSSASPGAAAVLTNLIPYGVRQLPAGLVGREFVPVRNLQRGLVVVIGMLLPLFLILHPPTISLTSLTVCTLSVSTILSLSLSAVSYVLLLRRWGYLLLLLHGWPWRRWHNCND